MTTEATAGARRGWISDIHREVHDPHPRAKVWRARTDPDLVRRWLMEPEGFEPVVGTCLMMGPGWGKMLERRLPDALGGVA